jgi:serine/threonine protein kinase/WD40 repeat protein
MPNSSDERNPVERLAEEFLLRDRRGERPSLTEYTQRYPHLAAEIRELFPVLLDMEDVRPKPGEPAESTAELPVGRPEWAPQQLGDYRILREVGRGGMGIVYEAEQESLGRRVALKVLLAHARLQPRQLARFKREARAAARLHHTNIVPVFGVGEDAGFHYYVMQFIHGQGLDEVLREIRRLRRTEVDPGTEAASHAPSDVPDGTRAAAPNEIAQALLTGQFARDSLIRSAAESPVPSTTPPDGPAAGPPAPAASGSPAATAPPLLVHAESTIRSDPECDYWRSVARIGIQVAEALHYAHTQSILHRDIKPSNLLLDLQGSAWVTDFGLAKAIDEADLTHPGDVVGTLRYMPPERFQNQSDARSDLYSLGLSLYELLAFRPAYQETSRERLIQQLTRAEPPPPSKFTPEIPRDLETIVLKTIERDPASRYQSAAELADDLRRFLEDRPIGARRVAWRERTWRWCRRNPAVAALSLAVVLLLLTMTVGSLYAAVRFARERDRAVANQALAESNEYRARTAESKLADRLWDSYLSQARALRGSRAAGQRFQSLGALAAAARYRVNNDLRDEAIACLALVDLRQVHELPVRPEEDRGLDVDPRLELCAVGKLDGSVELRRTSDGSVQQMLPKGPGPCVVLRFGPGGRHLGANYLSRPGHTLSVLWRLEPSRAVRTLELEGGSFEFSADGRLAASIVAPETIGIFDVDNRNPVSRLKVGPVSKLLPFRPDSRQIAVADAAAGTIRVHDVETGALAWSHVFPAAPRALGWRGDGRLLAVSCLDHLIYIWDLRKDRLQSILEGHQNQVIWLEFQGQGDLLLSSSWDLTTRIWDPVRGRHLLTARGNLGRIGQDQSRISLIVPGYRVGLWEFASGRECRLLHHGMVGNRTPRPEEWGPRGISFSRDGRLLASSDVDGAVLWDARTGRELAQLPIGAGDGIEFSPDGSHLITCGGERCQLWPVKQELAPGGLAVTVGPPKHLAEPGELHFVGRGNWDRTGRFVSLRDPRDFHAVVLDVSLNTPRARLGPHLRLHRMPISPDGTLIATSCWKGQDIVVWDVATRKELWREPTRSAYALFSPDGKWLATSQFPEPTCKVRRVGSWEEGPTVPLSASCMGAMAFSPEGRMFAVNELGRVRLVELPSGNPVATLDPASGLATDFTFLAFSPDGTQLAAVRDHTIVLWDLRLIRSRLEPIGLDWEQPPYPAAPDPRPLGPVRVIGS